VNNSELEKLLRKEIPLSQAMGVRDFNFLNNEMTLLLPLAPNVNHKGTLFGGSLYSASALSCYGLFLSGLRENGVNTNNIVISEGHMKYFKPVEADALVTARWNTLEEKDKFFHGLLAKKKARVTMTAMTSVNAITCAQFTSSFVAWL